MSYESDGEKIQRLETMVELLNTQVRTVGECQRLGFDQLKGFGALVAEVITVMQSQGDTQVALVRYLCDKPAFIAEADRQGILDKVASIESYSDRLAAVTAALKKVFPPPPPLSATPAPEG
ncbi:MAG TPA: hypothetical protein VK815_18080 [Candidatus Acidoferrales bacterium]|nr:hypothetical protein [Candidatus Acidoferrales bacterium]